MIARGEFYHGLLYALRAHRDTFISNGPRFHEAFEQALKASTEKALSDLVADLLEDTDAMFGVYHGAGELVMQGMLALILVLEAPRFETARFKISKPDAHEELHKMKHADAYREMADAFHIALRKKGSP